MLEVLYLCRFSRLIPIVPKVPLPHAIVHQFYERIELFSIRINFFKSDMTQWLDVVA